MLVDKTIKSFATFLNISWKYVEPLLKDRNYTSNEDSLADWIQANWEILIERKILPWGNYLEVYGSGADFNGTSSRITDIDSLPTHTVYVNNLKKIKDFVNNEIMETSSFEFKFEEFVSIQNDFYAFVPPFKFVMVSDRDNKERVFLIDDIFFDVKKQNKSSMT